jgi:hypothetical protein
VAETPEATAAETARRVLAAAQDAEIPEVADVERLEALRVTDEVYLVRVVASDGDVGSVQVTI